jgi:flagellar basal-body rod protein FlgC
MNGMSIARSGLEASMLRLTASASNIANAQSTGAVPGSGSGSAAYQPVRAALSPSVGGGVQGRLVATDPAYRLTYDPASVHANADGMIAAPNVDVTDELVEQLSAKLAFEANLKVIAAASELERRSLDLWG